MILSLVGTLRGVNSTTSLRVSVRDVDDRATADASVALYEELLELPLDSIEQPVADPAPDGVRTGESAVVGEFLLQLASNRDVIVVVLSALQEWIGRRGRGSLEVVVGRDRLVLSDPSPEQQRQIVDAFVERMSQR
jgi:hypothetical protein